MARACRNSPRVKVKDKVTAAKKGNPSDQGLAGLDRRYISVIVLGTRPATKQPSLPEKFVDEYVRATGKELGTQTGKTLGVVARYLLIGIAVWLLAAYGCGVKVEFAPKSVPGSHPFERLSNVKSPTTPSGCRAFVFSAQRIWSAVVGWLRRRLIGSQGLLDLAGGLAGHLGV